MAAPDVGIQSNIDALLNRIDILHVNDVERAQPENVERLGVAKNSLALPYCLVLSSAALRGEGFSVPQESEKRVAGALDIGQGAWTTAVMDTYLALGSEATTGSGSEYMMVALGEEALATVRKRPPLGHFAIREMVKIAVDQDRVLNAQRHIVMHNIAVESQQ